MWRWLVACCLGALVCSNPVGAADSVRQLDLITNHLEYDAARGVIYASVPSRAGALGNTVVSINPASGEIVRSVYVGSEPGPMSLSDDGQFLYVALTGASAVQRVNLLTGQPDLHIELGKAPDGGNNIPVEVLALPNSPHSVAVAVGTGLGGSYGIAVYDDGMQRGRVSGDSGTRHLVSGLLQSRLYDVTVNQIRRFAVGAAGATEAGSSGTAYLFDLQQSVYRNGWVYTPAGAVFDAETGTQVGTYQVGSSNSPLRPDPETGRFFAVRPSSTGTQWEVTVFDHHTFVPIATKTLGSYTGFNIFAGDLVRWGTDGLAFRTTDGKVYLVQTDLVPPPLASVALRVAINAPDSAPAGTDLHYSLTVTNTGATTATGVFLADAFPTDLQVQAVSTSQGTATATGGYLAAQLGSLAPGASATVQLTLKVLQVGQFTSTARVVADQPEAVASDNLAHHAATVNPTLGPDLTGAFTSIHTTFHGGFRVTARLQVSNQGKGASAPCFVRVYFLDGGVQRLLRQVRVRALRGQQSVTIPVALKLKFFGSNARLHAIIDVANTVGEANEGDNTADVGVPSP